MPTFTRYRFGSFVVSPRQRQLRRDGEPVPLIPKYFDLLVVLVSRRQEAVSKAAIFDAVWSDVVVSDGALSQAVRTLRRTLGDDPRDPRFIRTVPRHGYQFVFDPVVEEADELDASPPRQRSPAMAARPAAGAASEDVDSVDRLVTRLFAAADRDAVEDARERAEQLHALGTGAALAAIRARPNHAVALAFMRDARWTVPGAGAVRLLGDSEAARAILAVVRLRLADVRRMVAERWAAAAVSGATGGALAGLLGGLALWLAPTSTARPGAMVALAAIGFTAGAVGAGGIGAGLIAAEVLARSRRGLALVALGGVAGLAVAVAARALTDVLLDNLFGIHAALGSPLDGLVVGVAVGAGYALATRQPPGGGLAAPSGWRRVGASAMVGASCAAAGVVLAAGGSPLIGGLVHDIARTSREARLALEPLGRLIGEPGFGPFTRALLSAFEGGVFGAALTWGLTRRIRPRLHVSA